MKTYNNQQEVGADLVDGTLTVNGDVRFNFDVTKRFSIDADNIEALNIDADNIDAHDIKALNIDADNIDVRNIVACDIKAYDIYADNIYVRDIYANEISYSTFCIAQQNIKCSKITGRSANSSHKCLDGELIIKED